MVVVQAVHFNVIKVTSDLSLSQILEDNLCYILMTRNKRSFEVVFQDKYDLLFKINVNACLRQ